MGQDDHITFATLSLPVDDLGGRHAPEIREALGTPDGFEPTLVGGEAAVETTPAPSSRTTSPRPR